MALAGYSKSDIDVEVADGVLTIKSMKTIEDSDNKVYRGIASRNFTRKFTIADDIVVKDGSLKDGMLSIELERVVPEEKKATSREDKIILFGREQTLSPFFRSKNFFCKLLNFFPIRKLISLRGVSGTFCNKHDKPNNQSIEKSITRIVNSPCKNC